jgi:hypothetical protein
MSMARRKAYDIVGLAQIRPSLVAKYTITYQLTLINPTTNADEINGKETHLLDHAAAT